MFLSKNIVLFTSKEYDKKTSIFEEAKSLIIETCPSKNAFGEYKNILKKANEYDKNHILCFEIGPTSKVLVYE